MDSINAFENVLLRKVSTKRRLVGNNTLRRKKAENARNQIHVTFLDQSPFPFDSQIAQTQQRRVLPFAFGRSNITPTTWFLDS